MNIPAAQEGPQCLTAEEHMEFTRWLVDHAIPHSEFLFFSGRGNRSLVMAHILRDVGYPHAYSVGAIRKRGGAGLPVAAVDAGRDDRAWPHIEHRLRLKIDARRFLLHCQSVSLSRKTFPQDKE